MSKRLLQVGIVQFSMENEASKNIEKAITAIEDLADQGAECIVLPELFLTKYFCQKEDVKFFSLAEDVPGKTTKIFEEIAGRRSVSIVLSLFEKVNTGIYFNTVAYIYQKRVTKESIEKHTFQMTQASMKNFILPRVIWVLVATL